ncbi:Pentatricopeptide repeat [Dillenia turbinata]|uniref:Pentatricopeptide repeat n=1 Tax=Dillenia turbinata TaxID=194707 RepID=A0AAN8VZX4_9MAGN
MPFTGVLSIASKPPIPPNQFPKVSRTKSDSIQSSLNFSSSSSTTTTATTTNDSEEDITKSQKFTYSRASPSVRWPNLKLTGTYTSPQTQFVVTSPQLTQVVENDDAINEMSEKVEELSVEENENLGFSSSGDGDDETLEVLGRPSKTRAKKMTKLALKRAKDWRRRVQILTDKILGLKSEEFVADVLDDRSVQMTPTDFCFVVKWVGQSSWQRALEVYEWLNLRHWYSPNARMLATILSVLGKANQERLAVEIFTRVEEGVAYTVQVYNAMMGVYARNGRFSKVQELLDLMRERGSEPDLVSFNTLINARTRLGSLSPNLAIELLNEVRRSGLRPDIITYNTLISACSRDSNLEEAAKVFGDMEAHKCQPDLWTYNAMISVYGRCGLPSKAEQLFKELESKGFSPDAVTYNSLLYAFAREGNVVKVKEICEEMVKMGFGKDEMTYNTIIHMYGKQGQQDLVLQLYRDMKVSGLNPDVVTYTVIIDSLGKANKITEAASVMSEMLDAGVKPTVRTFSALICGYSKAGKRVDAEETFSCMRKSGIRPDHLAYSVMLDILCRSNETKKVMSLYKEMVRDGYTPDNALYEVMLRAIKREDQEDFIQKVVQDMQVICGLNPQAICSILVNGECYENAAQMLRLAIHNGYELDKDSLLSILSSYSASGRHAAAQELLEFVREHAPTSQNLLSQALVVILCKASQLDGALAEYGNCRGYGSRSLTMYESLIYSCEKNELFAEASQVFSDMGFCGIEPSENLFRCMVVVYCKMGFPETAQHLIYEAEKKGISFDDMSYVDLIETYGKLKQWQRAESVVGNLKQSHSFVDRRIWNALIHAYATSGCYERARAVFNTMMREGPYPTLDSINGLLQALIIDGRLNELYVVIQELQDMGFKISKSSILLMLDAFAREGNIFEVKKIYDGMKAAGYFPNMHLYRTMIGLFSRGKRVRDVEVMVSEMQEVGFKPDLSVWNALLKMYTGIGDFKKTAQVFQQIQEDGLKPDEDTYNILILMYCRDRKPEEGLSLMRTMQRECLEPKLDTYKSLMSACSKQLMVEQTEELFADIQSKGCKLDRSFYHILMKMYRTSGDHSKAEKLLFAMKEAGVEPTIATMHLLMISYSSSGQPEEAEKVLSNLKVTGSELCTLPYSSVIDAYLKNGDFNVAIQKLVEMKKDGLDPDHRIWTCFIRAASLSQYSSEARILLDAIKDVGFDLPIRLLTEKSEMLIIELDQYLEKLQPLADNAAFNFVNALEDLLWAFEFRATASWVFQLAIKKGIYRHDVFRVAEKDWGADFRKLSAGAALVGLTLWLDHMQASYIFLLYIIMNIFNVAGEAKCSFLRHTVLIKLDASLQGSPESPKSVVIITGTSDYNMVSLNSTLKAFLWEMGSPFLPCKTRSGLLIAKAHSLRMWLKDSPFCLDLELKDASCLPDLNSMQLIEGCFMRRGLVPAFKDITEKLGLVWPKKFARLALLSDEKRERAIQADIKGRMEKLEKMRNEVGSMRTKRKLKPRKRKFIRRELVSGPEEMR